MQMTCINCPLGCLMEVVKKEDKIEVKGNLCKKGEKYAVKECTQPTRIVTTSVFVEEGEEIVVSVKTRQDIPKEKIFQILCVLKEVKVKAPIKVGDVIVPNILQTGVDVVATRNVKLKNIDKNI